MSAWEFANGNVVVLYCRPEDWGDDDDTGIESSVTLVLGIRASDGILLAADGRVVGNVSIALSDEAQKLYGLGRFGLGFSGSYAFWSDNLKLLQRAKVLERCADIDEAENASRKFLVDHYLAGRPDDVTMAKWPAVEMLIAGYDKAGESSIRCLHSKTGFSTERARGEIGTEAGQVCMQVIRGLLGDETLRFTLEQATVFAAMALRAAMRVDFRVGGRIRMATVKPDAGYVNLDYQDCVYDHHLQRNPFEELREMIRKGTWE